MMAALDGAAIAYEYQFGVGGKFLCDFYLPAANLIIECDGLFWHSRPSAQRRDASKDAYLRKCGYTVMRFTDRQINSNIAECIAQVHAYLIACDTRD